MKELVGKIYRDENGNETIERVTKKNSLWKIEELFTSPSDPEENRFSFAMVCPMCGGRYNIRTKDYTQKVRFEFDTPRLSKYTYCGYCGHKNIVEVEI